MKTITGVLIKPSDATYEIKTVEYDDSPYYPIRAMLGDHTLESPSYRFGKGKDAPILDCICDEEGRWAYEAGMTDVGAMDSEQRVCVFGDFFVVRCNDGGEWVSLTESDIVAVIKSLALFRRRDGKEVLMALVEYPYWNEHKALMEQAEREGWGIIEG